MACCRASSKLCVECRMSYACRLLEDQAHSAIFFSNMSAPYSCNQWWFICTIFWAIKASKALRLPQCWRATSHRVKPAIALALFHILLSHSLRLLHHNRKERPRSLRKRLLQPTRTANAVHRSEDAERKQACKLEESKEPGRCRVTLPEPFGRKEVRK